MSDDCHELKNIKYQTMLLNSNVNIVPKKEQSNKESSALSFSSFDKQFPEKNVDEIFDKIEAL